MSHARLHLLHLLTFEHLDCLEWIHAVFSQGFSLELEQLGLLRAHAIHSQVVLLLVAQILLLNLPHNVLVVFDFVRVEALLVLLGLLCDSC